MKLRVAFYYVGDLRIAVESYSALLKASPIYADEDWFGFRQVGEIQALPYGKQAQVRDSWGNRLSLVQPAEGYL